MRELSIPWLQSSHCNRGTCLSGKAYPYQSEVIN